MAVLAEMLVGNRGPIESLAGLEAVARAARLVLVDSLDEHIDRVQQRWRAADEQFELAGYDAGVVERGVEHVPSANVLQGPHRSLHQSPISMFPNVCVTGYAVRPGRGDAQQDIHRIVEVGLVVELMVAAGPIDGLGQAFYETLAHRRVERTSEAVLAAIGSQPTLLGTVIDVGPPRGGIVNMSWVKKTEGGTQVAHVLHGARFQYALTRLAARYG